jgi:hypothetical protein
MHDIQFTRLISALPEISRIGLSEAMGGVKVFKDPHVKKNTIYGLNFKGDIILLIEIDDG